MVPSSEKLAKMLETISKEARLSKFYTSRSIHFQAGNVLKETGHANDKTIGITYITANYLAVTRYRENGMKNMLIRASNFYRNMFNANEQRKRRVTGDF